MRGGSSGARSGRSCRENAVGNPVGSRPGCALPGAPGGRARAGRQSAAGDRRCSTAARSRPSTEHLASGKVRTVVFENSLRRHGRGRRRLRPRDPASGVNTEAKGQCHAACAYAFLAGKEHRFGRGFQVNGLLIPVAARPAPDELASRWRGEEANRTLADSSHAPGEAGDGRGAGQHAEGTLAAGPRRAFHRRRPRSSGGSTTASTATARRAATPRAASCCPTPTRTSSAC